MIRRLCLNSPALDLSNAIARHSGDQTRVYKQLGDQKLLISLYNPPCFSKNQKYPLLMLIHGGGWSSRRVFDDQTDWAGDYLGFLGRYFADRGYICASVDYRLLKGDGGQPGYELMDLYDDCADATAYLKENAEKLCIDVERTAVLGESVGGHLAAALVTLPWREKGF
ncbi:MAG: alpha/beta hydrolase, partial [Clostridiales bacterium]